MVANFLEDTALRQGKAVTMQRLTVGVITVVTLCHTVKKNTNIWMFWKNEFQNRKQPRLALVK